MRVRGEMRFFVGVLWVFVFSIDFGCTMCRMLLVIDSESCTYVYIES